MGKDIGKKLYSDFFLNTKITDPNFTYKSFNVIWIEIHKDELIADWELAVNGQEIFKIDPLK